MRVLTRLLFLIVVTIFSIVAEGKRNPPPKAFHFPIQKHEPTKQFFTSLDVGTSNRSSLKLALDLSSNLSWLIFSKINSSSSLRKIRCGSSGCSAFSEGGCDDGGFCFRQKPIAGRVCQDRASFHSIDGSKPLARVSIRSFTFLCSADHEVSLPTAGVLGLAGGDISFPAQVASAFGVIRKFAFCFPSYGTGHFFIAGGPYFISPAKESPMLNLTPFGKLPGSDAGDYYLILKYISVDGNPITINETLLSVDDKGNGGTKISTVVPYTVLHSDIYQALVQSFANRAKAMGIREAPAVALFRNCYEASSAEKKETGPNVPAIDFTMPGRMTDVKWRFYGGNTMVKVKENVICLAFIDGGTKPMNSIVLGTHQLQNYLIEFDLSRSIFGFSDSLLLQNTSCSIPN